MQSASFSRFKHIFSGHFNRNKTYAIRFVVAQFIARPAGCSLACMPPDMLFCVKRAINEDPVCDLMIAEPTTNLWVFNCVSPINMKKGTMWIQDARLLHRGAPKIFNEEPRPKIVVCYVLSWFSIRDTVKVPPKKYAGFLDRARKLFQFCQIMNY